MNRLTREQKMFLTSIPIVFLTLEIFIRLLGFGGIGHPLRISTRRQMMAEGAGIYSENLVGSWMTAEGNAKEVLITFGTHNDFRETVINNLSPDIENAEDTISKSGTFYIDQEKIVLVPKSYKGRQDIVPNYGFTGSNKVHTQEFSYTQEGDTLTLTNATTGETIQLKKTATL